MIYNSYNNSIYLSYINYKGSSQNAAIDIFDAESGTLKSKIALDSKMSGCLAFDDNGFGIILADNIYSINSADNHQIEVLSIKNLFYTAHPDMIIPRGKIRLANNYQKFVFMGSNSSGAIISYLFDVGTKTASRNLYTNLEHFYSANFSKYQMLYSSISPKIQLFDITNFKSVLFEGSKITSSAALIKNEPNYPLALTYDLRLISFDNQTETKFSGGNASEIFSSQSGNYTLIAINNQLFMYPSTLFSKQSQLIK